MKKNNFVLLFVCFLIIGNLFFVLAEENKTINLAEVLGLEDVEVYCENCNYQILDQRNLAVHFTKENSKFIDKDGNVFDGIDFKKDCYVILNSKGDLERADLWTVNEARVFSYLDESLFVPANSRIIINKGKVQITAADNSVFPEVPSYSKNFNLEISGNNVKISEDLLLKSGEVAFFPEGYFLEGKAIFNKIKIFSGSSEEPLLLAFSDPREVIYGKNFVFQEENKLIFQSSSLGEITASFLEGNDVVGVGERDLFEINIKKGDGLVFTNKGGAVKIEHKSSDGGSTTIEDDGFGFNLKIDHYGDESLLKMKRDFLKLDDIYSGDYLPLAFELESDYKNFNDKVVLDKDSKLCVFSSDGEEKVNFESYGLPKLLREMTQDEIIDYIDNFEKSYSDFFSSKKLETTDVKDFKEILIFNSLKAGLSIDEAKMFFDDLGKAGGFDFSSSFEDDPTSLERLNIIYGDILPFCFDKGVSSDSCIDFSLSFSEFHKQNLYSDSL
ncbi:MAG: hypothetical protein KJ566_01610 [Nanoarchaeota archaeon]|nr:hypothetical protein [Nanoarchaeota archaeon]